MSASGALGAAHFGGDIYMHHVCTQCNNAIGCFEDDVDRLLAAVVYLQRGRI